MVFFSEDGDPIMPVVGYFKPQQLEPYLKMIKQGDYAVFSTPEDIKFISRTLFLVFEVKFIRTLFSRNMKSYFFMG